MKKILSAAFAAVLTLLALSSCGKYKYETVKGDPMQTKIYTLDNGLKVFMTVNKEQPRIQTYIAVKVGGKNDPSETTGLAHYFEHLMFKGTPSFGTSDYEAEKPMLDEIEALFETYRQTTDEAARAAIYHKIDSISYEASKLAIPNEYDKLMAMIGADGTNAWTSQDETVYTEDIPSNQIENWARIQADRFMNPVLRGFHTELETIYEEKNMSLTQDTRKLWENLDAALFPHHPYGTQTVLGTQEHLKNPSITNVRKYHDTYYVPNNVAICLSGDFNPDEMVAVIEKYFGGWEPNPEIPALEYEPEAPITEPIVRNVYGLEAEMVAMGWPLPGARDIKCTDIAQIVESVLSNGQAGIMDLDLNQQQKVLYAGGGCNIQPDYSFFLTMARPKQGQTLEEARDLMLGEIEKLRNGDFDEELLTATINNYRLNKMYELEDNSSRAHLFVDAFINGIDWKEAAGEIDRLEKITKEDVVEWANEYLGAENYAIVYKRMGEDKTVSKISAPKITPIVTNRDNQSAFLNEIQNTEVKPIEPSFLDFSKEMSVSEVVPGVELLYKKNTTNGVASLQIIYENGLQQDPALALAFDYIQYLGTSGMSAEEIAMRMYDLACEFSFSVGDTQSSISVSGLAENIPEALGIVKDLVLGAEADDDILDALKGDVFKARADAKLSQRTCYSALVNYMVYGPEFIRKTTLTNDEITALTSGELLAKVAGLFDCSATALYYGPVSEKQASKLVGEIYDGSKELKTLTFSAPARLETRENSVIMAQYDAKQIYYQQYSNRGEKYSFESTPEIALYNEYFGGGMNTIVFQEMREARSLAYSAWAMLRTPAFLDQSYYFQAFIATQNDKMRQAIEAFDDIINNMPESEAAFSIAKDAILSRLRTERVVGADVLSKYFAAKKLGNSETASKLVFEKVQDMTLEDVKAFQQEWIKDRNYTYAILGDIKDLDTRYLSTLGPVKTVTLEEIFGY